MKIINQLKTGAILSYLQIFVTAIIGIVYTPIMLRYLGSSEFGVYSLCASIIGYLTLLNFGFSGAYIRYYSLFRVENDNNKIKNLNGMFFLIFMIIGISILLLGSLISFRINDILGNKFNDEELVLAKTLLFIMTINVAIVMPSSVFSSFVAAHEKFVFLRGIDLIKVICNPIITLPLLMIGYRSIAVILVTTFLTIVAFLINIWFCIRKIKVELSFKQMDFVLLKDIFWFSFFIFLQSIMDKLNWEINKFIVGRYCGSIAVAIYSIGTFFNMMFIQFSTAISNVFIPRVNKLVAENQGNEIISSLFAKVARIQFIIIFYVFSAFVFLGEKFILFWIGSGYENSYIVALLLMSPILLALTQNLGIEIVRAKKLHKAINLIYVGFCIISVIITIPLTQRYNEIGGAIGTCITMFVSQLIIANLYFHYVAKIDIKLYFQQIFKFIPASILPCIAGSVILFHVSITTVFDLIVYGSTYTLVYFFSYWLLGMNQYERGLVYSLLNKFRR
ncbi:lipopolysaccharide biosynthesis protein [Anaerospora hongkongensis]|uniref:lipopolysaccharide biosynthesis protein n=1 Tax=Anaerospora hongkongensis TaxID=244830 RepID=UPI00289CABD4|nr:oligosaccharide flippase family protein [Anaerospora hongkongensis]